MKKLFITTVALLALVFTSNAQSISENALGLRLGDSDGFGAEISYQRALGDNNRLEFDLGWRDGNNYDGFKLAGLYQWVMPLDGNFNWYVGAGGGIGSFSIETPGNDVTDTFIFAAGDIGIEYDFDIPLQLSLDFRPEIGFGDDVYDNNDLDFDIALGIRYQF
ncbi:porin family protein [Seonamhaeicola algicola]|uniref:Porin family protein n=1 Tax=Seonamhaeicola algicola TaxID=1719036 RepID=A0A5C7B3S4_9FLAO|nr:porin family protein [Seonamhaeicola algicola]TXE15104.1 porin family protein [Seonamhaeicola algicola]